MHDKKVVIIFGSSNSFGNTRQIVEVLKADTNWNFIDLNTKNISYFDYKFKNRQDDFISLMSDLVQNYDIFIFATPVYWYTMSGIMKVFFDRISDLLKIEQQIGRQLRGKQMAVVACGADKQLVDGFYMPFRESAKYLGMEYIADYYGNLEENELNDLIPEIDAFKAKIL